MSYRRQHHVMELIQRHGYVTPRMLAEDNGETSSRQASYALSAMKRRGVLESMGDAKYVRFGTIRTETCTGRGAESCWCGMNR